jgi:hypothetical protein
MQQTCAIENNASDASWCLGGFHHALEPVIEPFLEKVDSALGVDGGKYTLEVYFQPGVVPTNGPPEVGPNGLCQVAFYGTHRDRCDGVCMDRSYSPPALALSAGRPYQKHIDDDPQLFFDGDRLKDRIYFRRYAASPIHTPCRDDMIGMLILTSMQDEPFPSSALDTLAFLATLVSNFLGAYCRCFEAHQRARPTNPATRELIPQAKQSL